MLSIIIYRLYNNETKYVRIFLISNIYGLTMQYYNHFMVYKQLKLIRTDISDVGSESDYNLSSESDSDLE